jgi:uncharacterized membrane protein YkoI
MKKIWTLGVMGAFLVAFSMGAAAQQAATKPATATQKPVVKKDAKTEKEDEKEEATGGMKVKLPDAVSKAFKTAYPGAVIKGTDKETENGKTVYEVESVDKGLNRDLLYAENGTVLECEEQVKEADLPAPVMAAFKQAYPKATITKAEKTTKGTVVQYDLALKNAAKPEASFFPDGKPVPAAAPEKK